MEEDWQYKNVRYFILLSSSTNLVIFVKVIFVIFDFENEKKFYKEYIYKYYLYIFFIEGKSAFDFENDKNDFDKNDTLSLLRLLILYGFVTNLDFQYKY